MSPETGVEFPFYPDHGLNPLHPDEAQQSGLVYDPEQWKPRRYAERNIRNQTTVIKFKYEIPLGDLPGVDKIGEDLTLTPMAKYIWTKKFDRKGDEIGDVLNPRLFVPTDLPPVEYLRFNIRSREDVLGVRLDYQFSQRVNILAGFQYRKFTNRDNNFKNFLTNFPVDEPVPVLFRPDIRTRIFEIQMIKRGEWLGFNIVILSGFRRTRIIFERTTTKHYVHSRNDGILICEAPSISNAWRFFSISFKTFEKNQGFVYSRKRNPFSKA